MTWFIAGGFPMVFIALFGAIALASGARYAALGGALRPSLAYGAAVGCMSIAGAAVDLSFVGRHIGAIEEDVAPAQLLQIALVGVGEALAPIVFGFAVLCALSLLCAIGLQRHR